MQWTEKQIEAAARALCEWDRLDPDGDWTLQADGGFQLSIALEPGKHQRWRIYAKKAKAALDAAAAAEPTDH